MKIQSANLRKLPAILCSLASLCYTSVSSAQNPLIRDMYSADPTARVFGDTVYVYPSHDILARPGHGRVGWFCMEDYHVFASVNLTDWRDDGIVVSQYNVPWADSTKYSMWAPDCVYHNGKYYFYFPSIPRDTSHGRGFTIGVAISDKPSGPFLPEPAPIRDVHGIDPNVFIDKDGQAYLYWAQGNIYGAKLKDNMLELASEVKVLGALPEKGLKEGPFLFERNGLYYLTYPHVENKTERLEYAIGNNPLGPFTGTGVIMDETPGCWTNHHSLIELHHQWYLFYHSNDLSPSFDKARSIRADSLFFNADGTIRKVTPTLRGIGITDATARIQVDRYSAISSEGASIGFIDTLDHFAGWKTILAKRGAFVQYNTVKFGNASGKWVSLKVNSTTGAKLQIRSTALSLPPIADVEIPKTDGWQVIKRKVAGYPTGTENLVLESTGTGTLEIDWIQFE